MSYFTPLSFWEQDTYFVKVDVAIIGGGIVGMNAALRLRAKSNNLSIVIIERSSIGTAASSRNAGFACYGSPSEIIADLEVMSEDKVHNLVKRRCQGLSLLQSIVGTDTLGYMRTGGHEAFLERDQLDIHLDKLATINQLVQEVDPALKFYHSKDDQGLHDVAGVISNDWEGQIHPGKMTMALRTLCTNNEIRILTNVEVEEIKKEDDFIIGCGFTEIRADRVIISTNAFANDLVDIETEAGRNQVLMTSPLKSLKIKGCYHYDRGYVYFRNVGDRLLIGGGRNLDQEKETTDQFGQTTRIKDYLIAILNRHILTKTSYQIEHEWSGILGFNQTKEPIIQEVEPGKFVAVGLGGMGVAIGTLVGQEVADLLLQS